MCGSARCEILRMTVLKLNMSNSNAITIKRKSLENTRALGDLSVCAQEDAHTDCPSQGKIAERAICQKLLSERQPSSYWFDRTRHSMHTVTLSDTTVL